MFIVSLCIIGWELSHTNILIINPPVCEKIHTHLFMALKSKQTIEKTIKEIKSLGFTDLLEFDNVTENCYFNKKNSIGIYINFQEVGYPTLFEVCWFTKRKGGIYDTDASYRVCGMNELKQSLVELCEENNITLK